MSEVLEMLSLELDEKRVREIADHLGTNHAETEAAISAALPTLVSAMGRTVDTEHGSQMIASKMQGIGGGSLGDLLGGLLGSAVNRNTAPQLPQSSGMGDILGSILGGKQQRVEDSIGKSSGMNSLKVGPLLAILVPLVLGAMKAKASARPSSRSGGINTGDLTEMMRGERKSIEQKQGGSLIGRMLDQDGDGDFDLSDIMKLGMRFFFNRR